MAVEVLLPKLGLTMEEGLIDEFVVEPGTSVKVGDIIMRIETDKVDADIEAEHEGVFYPAVPAGTTLAPGAVVGWLLADGEEAPSAPSAATAAPETPAGNGAAQPASAPDSAAPAPAPNQSGRFLSSPNARRVATDLGVDITTLRGTGPGGRVVAADVTDFADSAPGPTRTTRHASPLVRKDAAVAGIDVSQLEGSGPGGRLRRADVRAAATPAAEAARPASDRTDETVPLSVMRRVVAQRMHASLQEMAQLTLGTEVTMDAAVALRASLKSEWADAGIAVPTITDLIVRAAALALRAHPAMNATFTPEAITEHGAINVGVAVALDEGLMVPVVHDADLLSLSELAGETRRLSTAARAGNLRLPELEGGTFTVSTLGTYGIDFFTPVITPGQAGILGVGRLRDSVRWEADDRPARTQVLTLSLTFDHRAVDGAPAAAYLATVSDLLTRPLQLLR